MQFVSTVLTFLHIMIRHTVDFCKNEPHFMPLILFHSNCILLLMMKMNKKQFFISFMKNKSRGSKPLNVSSWYNINKLFSLSLISLRKCCLCYAIINKHFFLLDPGSLSWQVMNPRTWLRGPCISIFTPVISYTWDLLTIPVSPLTFKA